MRFNLFFYRDWFDPDGVGDCNTTSISNKGLTPMGSKIRVSPEVLGQDVRARARIGLDWIEL